ncbi:hypothetical protein BN946_scf184908.g143 [Trametes cinnabarina]|uniref:Uncharacterized protein n=1 Tax=Pycnoporus cinnabarinus TaxID=5643 RepID=A0A060SAL7_PYCCI|nr:hypothetical protein BN946_scf184908.g143 [Trametes cinnabarina]
MGDELSDLHLSVQERIELAISRLPVLTKADIPIEDSCPICLNPFDAILEPKAADGAVESPPEADELAGVTKLVACGHIFCRAWWLQSLFACRHFFDTILNTRSLVEWIQGRHGSCPSCRNVFSSIRPASDSDNESSDGDYVPGDDEDEDDEDDAFFDSDGFMDTESVFDDMDIEEDADVNIDEDVDVETWEDDAEDASVENWGLSDGDGSEGLSEVEVLAISAELQPENDDAGVYSDGPDASGSLRAPEDDSAEPK